MFLNVSNNKPQNRTLKMIPLLATYKPLLNSLGKVLCKNLNDEVKKLFYPVRLVSFRRIKNVSGYRVRPKVYSLETAV